jgi:uncharacterized membrane protein
MSEPMQTAPALTATEDKVFPAIVYGLYLVGLANGLTIILGVILAYASRERASLAMRSHYDFLISTFWLGLFTAIAAGVLMAVGAILSIILIGFPIMGLAWLIFSALGIWFVVRLVVGAVHLARDEAYPRPNAWLL